uniref:Uncharacterized protein n=1 Tax=Meloidogyne hapla TaxID=6305 RepID=A0A1I8BFS1_MELHA
MIKLIILSILYLNINLNLKCNGKLINVEIKIKDDWKEKREFIYLKNVEQKERFLLKNIENIQLTKKIVIEVANNEIVQNLLPKLEKQYLGSSDGNNSNGKKLALFIASNFNETQFKMNSIFANLLANSEQFYVVGIFRNIP